MIYQNGKVREGLKGEYGPELYVKFLYDFMERSQKEGKPFFAYYSMALAHDVTDDLKWQVPYAPGKDRWMNYGEMITSMDEMVGKLVTSMDRLNLRENTLVLFTGDNGTAARSKLRHLGKSGKKYEYEKVVVRQNGRSVPGGKGLLNDRGDTCSLDCKLADDDSSRFGKRRPCGLQRLVAHCSGNRSSQTV